MSRKKELLKNTFIIFLGKVSTQFVSFLLIPLYTSYLITSDYGYVDLIITYVSLFVPIVTLEQEMATFRFLIDSRNDIEQTKKIISSSIFNLFAITLIFLIICLVIIPFLTIKYKYLIVINIIVICFSNLLLQTARGLGKNKEYSMTCFIIGLITIFSNMILIIILKFGANGMIISTIIANIIGIFYLLLKLKLFNFISFNKISKITTKKMLKYSLPLIPNSICWWLINASDRTIITMFLGVAYNGIYAIACKFPTIISSLFSIFSLSWSESASLHVNDKDKNEFFSDVINNCIKIFSYVCIVLIAFIALIFKIIINNEYMDAYNYIPILILGSLFSCVIGVYSAIYIAKKDTKKVAITSFFSALINILINCLLITKIKLYAAAISTCVAYLSMMIYRGIDIKKIVKIKYNVNIIIESLVLFIVTLIIYYNNNLIINFVYFIIILVYLIITNKQEIVNLFNIIVKERKNDKK